MNHSSHSYSFLALINVFCALTHFDPCDFELSHFVDLTRHWQVSTAVLVAETVECPGIEKNVHRCSVVKLQ